MAVRNIQHAHVVRTLVHTSTRRWLLEEASNEHYLSCQFKNPQASTLYDSNSSFSALIPWILTICGGKHISKEKKHKRRRNSTNIWIISGAAVSFSRRFPLSVYIFFMCLIHQVFPAHLTPARPLRLTAKLIKTRNAAENDTIQTFKTN